jgi:hypothetical protein
MPCPLVIVATGPIASSGTAFGDADADADADDVAAGVEGVEGVEGAAAWADATVIAAAMIPKLATPVTSTAPSDLARELRTNMRSLLPFRRSSKRN